MVKRMLLIVALGATLVACGPGSTESPSLQSLDVPTPSPSGLDESPSGLDESPSGMEESPSASPSASPS
jgi:hypothetical protein